MTITDTPIESISPPPAPSLLRRPWFLSLVAFGVVVVLGALWFKIFEPIQVLPRIRLAPGFSLTDQAGAQVTSEDLRGSVVLYTFTHSACEEPCPAPEPTMAAIRDRIDEVDTGDTPVRFVTLSFDGTDTPAVLTDRAEAMGADGEQWFYATADEARLKAIIGSGFKTYFERLDNGTFAFDPALILVDGRGVVRGEYRYQTLASDTDRILSHIDILGEEVRNSNGPAGLAYEAAHFFLCYP
ncbi:MAG: SCO family protein [Acidimicrobiia bacterium]|nr:SCO family protein [Acidimicrobiia bacterium]MBT8217272.1 SCO family protein [Acidimicrobiia bacterium]NNF08658.1 SCO family protein [Acidimicrobiia bacterium]NNL70642.1 SCO family protein [Acidimicrobiia bacterium]